MNATASPRSAAAVAAGGAHQITDHTATMVTDEVAEPVDVILNVVRTSDENMAALVGLISDGGMLVTTTSPARKVAGRGVRAINMDIWSDAGKLAALVARIDRGDRRVDVSETHPLTQID